VGEYLTHKLMKMEKGKKVDEKMLKGKNNCFLKKRENNKAINEKRIVFEIMLHYSSNITISKTQKS